MTLALPNGFEWLSSCLAVWKLGAVPNPLSARLPARERDAIVDAGEPGLVVGLEATRSRAAPACPRASRPTRRSPADALPDRTSPHEHALASGGSTGRPS